MENRPRDVYQGCDEAVELIFNGTLGAATVQILITPYAQKRMKQRDIEPSEVLEALATSRSAHGRGQVAGRYEVSGKTLRGRVRVIYERPADDVVLVITAYPE